MVDLGMANSRMKDYHDLWIISQAFEIDRSRLAAAISATFARRGTAIPDRVPDGLSPTFAKDAVKRQQWESFKRNLSVDPGPLDNVVSGLEACLMPAAAAARDGGGFVEWLRHGCNTCTGQLGAAAATVSSAASTSPVTRSVSRAGYTMDG